MSGTIDLPWYSRLFRRIARPFFRFLFRSLARVEIYGRENIPDEGSYLVTPNHISIYEPPLLAAFWPRELEIAAAVEILDRPFQAEIMRLYGTVLVHRAQLDRSLITALLQRLAHGLPVLIFPEGTRTRRPGLVAGNTGSAYLAAKAGVAIIPVGIEGTYQLWEKIRRFERPRISMRIGRPLRFPVLDVRLSSRKEVLKHRTEEIMQAIAELLPADYQGEYAQ
ncbi:MAG: 1-acyl-sn-glycerol-3-phosphate acyltransferase [Anaerolineales bacterium]|nr:MAG: 1-acyl-sn-glycerol-3-phosphate acyltransferase [Anaerolineales bacterium]